VEAVPAVARIRHVEQALTNSAGDEETEARHVVRQLERHDGPRPDAELLLGEYRPDAVVTGDAELGGGVDAHVAIDAGGQKLRHRLAVVAMRVADERASEARHPELHGALQGLVRHPSLDQETGMPWRGDLVEVPAATAS